MTLRHDLYFKGVSQHIVEHACNHAKKSVMTHKHACIIFKHNKIVSIALNDYCNSKYYFKFSSPYSLHAEIKAVMCSSKDISGYSLLVVRVNNRGELLNSKPCMLCTQYLKNTQLKKIYYSTDEGSIECVKKNQLESEHLSFGCRVQNKF